MDYLYRLLDANEDWLLSWRIPIVMTGFYLSGIFMLKQWKSRQSTLQDTGDLKNQKDSQTQHTTTPSTKKRSIFEDPVRACMAAHNLFLFILSLVMAVATFYEAFIVRLPEIGTHELVCSRDREHVYNKGLFFWSAVFYFSKFYEYLDTVFIILNNRPLIFLHVWHHLSIAFLTLAFLNNHLSFLFTGVMINSAIHTAMYWSYFQTLIGKDVWWKRYLTQMQMLQFAWGIGSWLLWPFYCGFDTVSLLCIALDLAILSSFFYLFKQFYNTRYDRGSPSTKGRNTTATTPSATITTTTTKSALLLKGEELSIPSTIMEEKSL